MVADRSMPALFAVNGAVLIELAKVFAGELTARPGLTMRSGLMAALWRKS
jgi:hypothetical protein